MLWSHREAGAHAVRLRGAAGAVPPTGLVLVAVVSVQLGSALAKHLFVSLGPAGTVSLRVGFAAAVLLLVWRPRVRGYGRRDCAIAGLFGLSLVAMNLSFYLALDRIPLGIAVSLEFVGPLGVAVAGSRRLLDGLWAIMAIVGVVLLAPWGGIHLNPLGVLFALLAGSFWAAYILLSVQLGRAFVGGGGLAIAMTVGAMVALPIGIVGAGRALLDAPLLLLGLGLALLSSVIPYSLELEALRRLPARVFGVLMSTEPAVATLIGVLVLHEVLSFRALVAIALVTLAAYGASRYGVRAPSG